MPVGNAKGPEPRTRTFDEAFTELNLNATERAALVWHLAAFRARKTVEALLPETDPRLYGARSDVRKNRPLSG